ncbi:hypothetical protein ACI78Q_13830 [Geodermatophilus sp. SYSU D00705]
MSRYRDENVDNYLGVEGDVHSHGTGLNWLEGNRLQQLLDLLEGQSTDSAQTCLAMLDVLAEQKRLHHVELASRVGCTPAQLQSRNGKMTQLVRREFTGHRWPIGWHRGEASAGEVPGAYIYEMHHEVCAAWMELRPLTARAATLR